MAEAVDVVDAGVERMRQNETAVSERLPEEGSWVRSSLPGMG